jgi:hypothetical protein
MEKAKRARKAETLKQPSLCLRLRAPYLYPDQIDYRFAGGDSARIQANVAELVISAPDLILANSSPVVAALKQATRSIPIVFAVVNDPVGQGFVTSLAHPGGNSYRVPLGGEMVGAAPAVGAGRPTSGAHVQPPDRSLFSHLPEELLGGPIAFRSPTDGSTSEHQGRD